ncbi:hypothetical protein HIM_04501 [Hirsutella minnesotensis 3608]|uniref:SRP9 domain-containing protein n=1 Tax=Hirsutella minnesotensis 3608 TaxID=1043627 RepID=A0A0F7ZPT2_9HYPO|nr:hypothetical protein HIM_04501 [Hirsutella minnesotensis 3608]
MPYFKSSQEWLDQSVLLIEARPSTTRITTRYSIKVVKSRPKKSEGDAAASDTDAAAAAAKPPRGSIVIKTYDPVSGVTLKYRTTKAAEVSRLVYSSLGRLARAMAALPAGEIEEPMPDAPPAPVSATTSGDAIQTQQGSQQGGTVKRKKKGRK